MQSTAPEQVLGGNSARMAAAEFKEVVVAPDALQADDVRTNTTFVRYSRMLLPDAGLTSASQIPPLSVAIESYILVHGLEADTFGTIYLSRGRFKVLRIRKAGMPDEALEARRRYPSVDALANELVISGLEKLLGAIQ